MAVIAELHDGTRLEFPDGTDPAVVQRTVKSLLQKQAQPATQGLGEVLRDIPRQAGLVARTGIRAATAIPGAVADAVTGAYNTVADAMPGEGRGFRFQSTRSAVDNALTRLGLPEPQGANERVITDAGEMLLGTGVITKTADLAAKGAKNAAQRVFTSLAANPVVQGAGAVTAGVSGGSVREAGGGPAEQFAAALAGGIVGGLGAAKATDLAKRGAVAVNSMRVPRADRIVQADGAIEIAAQRAGINLQGLSEEVRRSLRNEVADALQTGRPLDEKALARLVSFRQTGTTPTVGMLTQDPVKITREQNLMRMGANSDDQSLQALSQLSNRNTNQLLSRLDEAGAAGAPDLAGAGRKAIETMDSTAARAKARIDSLYAAARDSSGKSLPLEGGTFTRRAGELLDAENVGSFLPADIRNRLNNIAQGTPGYELNVASAEQLKTSIGKLQRGTNDGNVRTALGLVRQALDEAPLQGSAAVNPGNLPAVAGSVPQSVQAGEQSILAFNKARTANRQWMQRVENNPALKAVVDGVEPDQFVQKFVIGKGASAADVAKLRGELDGQSSQALKQTIVRYLKGKATNDTEDIARFNNQTYRNALRDIGEDKLAVLFSAEERQLLKDIGEAGKYMQAQPAGSAVNNSNSGALVMARGWDLLDKLAGYVPLGGKDIIRGKITQPLMQREALDTRNALLQAAKIPKTPVRVNPLLAAVMPAEAGQDK